KKFDKKIALYQGIERKYFNSTVKLPAQELIELKEQVGVQETDHKKYQKIYPLFVSTQKHLAQTYQQFAQLREELADSEK
ncbi:hypothetical protein ABXM81_14365, partial [Enterococcus faecium]